MYGAERPGEGRIPEPRKFPFDIVQKAAERVYHLSGQPQGNEAELACFHGGLRALSFGEFPDLMEEADRRENRRF